MRKAIFLSACLTLISFMASCGDENETTPQVQFPETQIIGCQSGDTKQIEFDATAAWKLTSSASWCRFVEGTETVFSLAGSAGHQTVTLAIGDEGMSHETASTAKLTLYMNGQEGVLAEVTRSAAGYELKVYDADGNEISYITAGYNDYTTFQVKANFAFAVTSYPDWAELQGGSMVGAANTMTVGGIQSGDKAERIGAMLFQDMKGLASFTIPVVYNGMDRNAIVIAQPDGTPWNWNVSADGKTWTHDGKEYSKFITCALTAYGDDIKTVYIEETGDGLNASADWLSLNTATGRITALPTETDRTGYILAFPRALYDNLPEPIISAEGIAYTYLQNNLVVCVKQKATTTEPSGPTTDEVGFIAVCFDENWEMIEVECKRIADKAVVDHCEQAIGTRDVFLLDYRSPRGHFDMVTPYPQLTQLDDLDPEKIHFFNYDGTLIEDNVPESMYADSNNPPYWTIMDCTNTDTPIFLVIEDKAGTMKKALLIETK